MHPFLRFVLFLLGRLAGLAVLLTVWAAVALVLSLPFGGFGPIFGGGLGLGALGVAIIYLNKVEAADAADKPTGLHG